MVVPGMLCAAAALLFIAVAWTREALLLTAITVYVAATMYVAATHPPLVGPALAMAMMSAGFGLFRVLADPMVRARLRAAPLQAYFYAAH